MRVLVSLAVLSFVAGLSSSALGQTLPSYPKKAPSYDTWMVRAYDACTPSGLTVVSPTNVPNTGCLAANSVTDSVLPYNFARLRVAKSGKIRLYARGLTFGESVRVRLNLRVTRQGVSTKNPTKSGATVTFADVTVDCPPAPNAFVVRPNGSILGATDLNACLAPNSNLGGGTGTNNIEVLDASLVNVATGKELARAGVLR
ncbi:MAG: hypothetical protein N3C12_13295 [Candidatus Binatia bacterium]|nr:hypothetical protein [Candidatus Binatia bacterium]